MARTQGAWRASHASDRGRGQAQVIRPSAPGNELGYVEFERRARSARPREARLLKVPAGAPLLTMQRISYDDAGQPVEYGSHVYPAERYSFEMSVVADSRT